MKLITAIVNKEDSKNVCNELLKSKFYVTRQSLHHRRVSVIFRDGHTNRQTARDCK